MISDPQNAGRTRWVAGIILAMVFVTYVGTYAILRMNKVFIRKEMKFGKGGAPVWYAHAIETAGAVEDPSKRNVVLWTFFWPVHRLETAVRNVLQPSP